MNSYWKLVISLVFAVSSILVQTFSAMGLEDSRTSPTEKYLELENSAEEGDPISQLSLGEMFASGDKVNKDEIAALFWFEKAAEQGITKAMEYIGLLNSQGESVEKNTKLAYKWLMLASLFGYEHLDNQIRNLSTALDSQDKLQINIEIVKWIGKRAEAGVPNAQFTLGKMYKTGELVETDKIKAYKWLLISGVFYSMMAGRIPNADRDVKEELSDLKRMMSSAEIRQADLEVMNWSPASE